MTDRDWYIEAIDLVTNDQSPYTLELAHCRALWDVENQMTLRMAELHERAKGAEQALEGLRVELESTRGRLALALYEQDAWKSRSMMAEAELEEVLGHVVVPMEPDALDLGKRHNREQDEAHEERQKGEA